MSLAPLMTNLEFWFIMRKNSLICCYICVSGGNLFYFSSAAEKQERQTSREGSTAPCLFRISSEGLPLLLPYVTKQILYASPVDFKHLLQYKTIKFADFVDAEFGNNASNLMPGCCVIVLSKGSKDSSDHLQVDESTIAIGCWKGRGSLSVMVTATDCQELQERLLTRMEAENGSLVQEEKPSNGEPDKVLEINDTEKNENSESIKLATELN